MYVWKRGKKLQPYSSLAPLEIVLVRGRKAKTFNQQMAVRNEFSLTRLLPVYLVFAMDWTVST
jgi:hypothetical protein